MNSGGRRTRPEMTVGNYESVYSFYGPGRRRDGFTHPLLTVIDAIYSPDLRITPEVVSEIHRLHRQGVGIIVAVNHPSKHDATVLAATIFDHRVRFLSSGTGLTKDPIFRTPLRPLFEYTGTVPVFRAKNYRDVDSAVHVAAAERLVQVCVDQLMAGEVVLTFVEGTNSSASDLRTLALDSVKKGVGLMVAGARAAGAPVAVLPIGLAYHGREHAFLPPRKVVAVAGSPVLWASGPVPTVDDVRETVRSAIAGALDAAWG